MTVLSVFWQRKSLDSLEVNVLYNREYSKKINPSPPKGTKYVSFSVYLEIPEAMKG